MSPDPGRVDGMRVSSAAVADAGMRVGGAVRLAPAGLRPVVPGTGFAGPARPVRHRGSVDAILAAIDVASPGDVLVIDDGGLTAEACVGDLVALEALNAGLAGAVVWGSHRDTAQLRRIGFPVVSLGPCPQGPRGLRHDDGASSEQLVVSRDDFVIADDDGVVFIGGPRLKAVLVEALTIQAIEERQAAAARAGVSLRQQLDFAGYLSRRSTDPAYTFRRHVEARGGAIEA